MARWGRAAFSALIILLVLAGFGVGMLVVAKHWGGTGVLAVVICLVFLAMTNDIHEGMV